MSRLHPSPSTRRVLPRRLLQLTSLCLAGLLAGLLAGCSSDTSAQLLRPHNDTDWQTTSNYASATASLGPNNSVRVPHIRSCEAGPCELRVSSTHPSRRPGM
ncbi:MAG: hypothetical protein ABR910_07695 [Acidobacteriaceae bacterium]|jgi:hypothetical protein